jgi:hypothetical protein
MTMSTTQHRGAAFRAAEAFVDAIRSMPEWEEWESARAAVRTDPSFQALSARHRTFLEQARRASAAGRPVPGADSELERLRGELQRHPAAQRQQAAVLGLIGLCRALNGTLSDALGLDFAELAAPPRTGGCCG